VRRASCCAGPHRGRVERLDAMGMMRRFSFGPHSCSTRRLDALLLHAAIDERPLASRSSTPRRSWASLRGAARLAAGAAGGCHHRRQCGFWCVAGRLGCAPGCRPRDTERHAGAAAPRARRSRQERRRSPTFPGRRTDRVPACASRRIGRDRPAIPGVRRAGRREELLSAHVPRAWMGAGRARLHPRGMGLPRYIRAPGRPRRDRT